jgi:hypothetical protein
VKLVLHLRLVVSVILDLRLFAKLTPGFNTRGFSTHSEECPLVMGQNHKPVHTSFLRPCLENARLLAVWFQQVLFIIYRDNSYMKHKLVNSIESEKNWIASLRPRTACHAVFLSIWVWDSIRWVCRNETLASEIQCIVPKWPPAGCSGCTKYTDLSKHWRYSKEHST